MASEVSVSPPVYGSRQLHQTLDYVAATTPDRVYATIPQSSNLDDGFVDISFGDMKQCSDAAAHWIEDNFGRSSTFEALCCIGIPDLRTVAMFFGAVKCGYKVFFPSPRNPPETNAALLEQTQCEIVIYATEVSPITMQLRDARPSLICLAYPAFRDLLHASCEHFAYEVLPWGTAKNNPIVVLHSSGSTGLPKTIAMTHGSFGILDNERILPAPPGRRKRDFSIWDFHNGGRYYHVFPYFHLAGFLANIATPVLTEGSSPVLGPALQLPSPTLLKRIMESQSLRAICLPPATIEGLLREPGNINLFRGLDFLSVIGAPCSPATAKELIDITELVCMYGSTEAFRVPQLVPAKEDWAYMEWNPNFKLEMQPSDDEKGAYEMVLFADEETEHVCALYHNLPGVKEWRTKDLFKPHPTKPNLWRYFGRRDDIIVLSNSEKVNPLPLELALQAHPLLSGALVVGRRRATAALIVEPKPDTSADSRAALLEMIWPAIEEANMLIPTHGRITRSNVIVANKPFIRAAKGSVIRKLTESAFEADIAALYTRGKISNGRFVPKLKASFAESMVLEFVRSALISTFPTAKSMSDDEDFFSYGFDSMTTIELVGSLRAGIRAHSATLDPSWISPDTIFQYSTVRELATVVGDFLNNDVVPDSLSRKDRISRMAAAHRRYSSELPSKRKTTCNDTTSTLTVALTGSTGSLGTSILISLLKAPTIGRIFCLNRDVNAAERQRKALEEHGIPAFDADKVRFMTIHLGRENLGLTPEDREVLLQEADMIIHNAWRLDFNLSLKSFEDPHLKSIRTMVDLSAKSKKNARIVFVSSISSMIGSGSYVAESPPEAYSNALNLGYAESKCVAEMVLAEASKVTQTPVTILRVGQVAGSTNSQAPAWPVQEWLYQAIKAVRNIGVIPMSNLPINWVPADLAASAIADLILSPPTETLEVYNIVNPNNTAWSMLCDELQNRFGPGLKVTSLTEWVEEVQRRSADVFQDHMLDPALKLMKAARNLPEDLTFCTEKAVSASPTMATMRPIDQPLLRTWLDQWNFK